MRWTCRKLPGLIWRAYKNKRSGAALSEAQASQAFRNLQGCLVLEGTFFLWVFEGKPKGRPPLGVQVLQNPHTLVAPSHPLKGFSLFVFSGSFYYPLKVKLLAGDLRAAEIPMFHPMPVTSRFRGRFELLRTEGHEEAGSGAAVAAGNESRWRLGFRSIRASQGGGGLRAGPTHQPTPTKEEENMDNVLRTMFVFGALEPWGLGWFWVGCVEAEDDQNKLPPKPKLIAGAQLEIQPHGQHKRLDIRF